MGAATRRGAAHVGEEEDLPDAREGRGLEVGGGRWRARGKNPKEGRVYFRKRGLVRHAYRLIIGVGTAEEAAEEAVEVNERQVAVMMPFTDEASIDPVYGAIGRGVEVAGLRCVRVNQLVAPGDITEDIRRLIAESRTVIADLSGMNHNVMWELGFAHGRGKETLLVSFDPLKDLPCEIRSQRVLCHQRSGPGLDDLKGKMAEALMSIA